MNDSFNTVSTLHACNGCVQAGRTLIHSISARDASLLAEMHCKGSSKSPSTTVPRRASLGTLFARQITATHHSVQHGKAKARPSETNHHHHNNSQAKTKTTPETTGRPFSPLPSAATGLTLQTLSKPLPVNQSIYQSIDRLYTHACSAKPIC